MLPFYALLRCVPDKLAGLVVAAVALVLPVVAPWLRAERFRTGTAGVAWLVLCVSLAGVWAGLGWLGAQPPDADAILATRVLAVAYAAFFVLAAPLVARLRR